MTQPVARVDIVRDTYYGTVIEDPYRWMEEMKDQEMQSWIKSQAEYSRSYLDALPERAALLERINELDNASSNFSYFTPAGGQVFYLRRDPGENLAKLMVRSGEKEKVLLDPNKLAGEAHTAIDW